MQKAILNLIRKPGFSEATIWLLALIYFAFAIPEVGQHFTLCIFNWLGFAHCLGCGIGRSIGFLLHGDVATSWQMHYLGIPATGLLLFRIINIFYKNHLKHKKTELL